jgi:hypothetical protein
MKLTSGLIVVNVNALQLKVRVAMVGTSGVDAVLIGDDLPELHKNKTNVKYTDLHIL